MGYIIGKIINREFRFFNQHLHQIVEHLLKKPLTVVDQFHSHLEPMKFIRREILEDQVIKFSKNQINNFGMPIRHPGPEFMASFSTES